MGSRNYNKQITMKNYKLIYIPHGHENAEDPSDYQQWIDIKAQCIDEAIEEAERYGQMVNLFEDN